MRILFAAFLCSITVLIALDVSAQSKGGSQPLSKEDQKALDDTKAMLRDRNAVDRFAKENPSAKAVDENVKSLMGPDTGATYDLAADVFADIVKEANGDPAKLTQLIEELQKNPEKLAKRLSPAQQDKIRGLANKIEQRQGKAPPQH